MELQHGHACEALMVQEQKNWTPTEILQRLFCLLQMKHKFAQKHFCLEQILQVAMGPGWISKSVQDHYAVFFSNFSCFLPLSYWLPESADI